MGGLPSRQQQIEPSGLVAAGSAFEQAQLVLVLVDWHSLRDLQKQQQSAAGQRAKTKRGKQNQLTRIDSRARAVESRRTAFHFVSVIEISVLKGELGSLWSAHTHACHT